MFLRTFINDFGSNYISSLLSSTTGVVKTHSVLDHAFSFVPFPIGVFPLLYDCRQDDQIWVYISISGFILYNINWNSLSCGSMSCSVNNNHLCSYVQQLKNYRLLDGSKSQGVTSKITTLHSLELFLHSLQLFCFWIFYFTKTRTSIYPERKITDNWENELQTELEITKKNFC